MENDHHEDYVGEGWVSTGIEATVQPNGSFVAY